MEAKPPSGGNDKGEGMFLKGQFLLCVFLFVLVSCGGKRGEVEVSEPVGVVASSDSGYTFSPFTAKYYSEGADLSAPLVSETVEQISINFSLGDIGSLDLADFVGVWEGSVEVLGSKEIINANFSVSWSEVFLYVDGELTAVWEDNNKVIPIELERGVHSIRVELHNNWHTAGFHVSWTQSVFSSTAEIQAAADTIISLDSKVVAIAGYESSDRHNKVVVSLPNTDESVVLFLSTYDSVHWLIDNPYNVPIAGIFVGVGEDVLSTIDVDSSVNVYFTNKLDFEDLPLSVYDLIGRLPDKSSYSYSIGYITPVLTTVQDQQDLLPSFELSPFEVNYFSELITGPVLSESVEQVAIDYSWDDFLGIDSENFHATWDGSLEIFRSSQVVNIVFSVSWSDVEFFVDGKSVEAWSNSDKELHLHLLQGKHSLRVVYHNNWHTTDFSVVFSE